MLFNLDSNNDSDIYYGTKIISNADDIILDIA